jgi:hypothetical protein
VRAGFADGMRAVAPVNRNVKTGLILASVALAFFVAIIAKYWLIR